MANASKRATKRKDETTAQTWNKITGIMRVYGNTFETKKGNEITKWSATISGKTTDDKNGDVWHNYYVPVKFAGKDAEEPETDGLHVIDVENAFFSVDVWTNKKGDEVLTPVIIVTANEVVE